MAASTHPMLPGYRYVRPLGSGGYGQVFLYRQATPDRLVAVKTLTRTLTPRALTRFEAEADAMAALSSHPAIVTVYVAGVAGGRPFLAMAYCPGGSLAAKLVGGPLPLDEVLDVGVRIADALQAAHEVGIVHRDVKPANILLTAAGLPALADFGIAGAGVDRAPAAFSLPWASPEALEGHVSPAGDIYSLAATLITLLTGRPPFQPEGPTLSRAEMRNRILAAEPEPLPERVAGVRLPTDLVSLLTQCLAKRAAVRPASARHVAADLREIQARLGYRPTPAASVPGGPGGPGGDRSQPSGFRARERLGRSIGARIRSNLSPARISVVAAGLAVAVGGTALAWQAHVGPFASLGGANRSDGQAATTVLGDGTATTRPSPTLLDLSATPGLPTPHSTQDLEALIPGSRIQRVPSLLPGGFDVSHRGGTTTFTWPQQPGVTYRRIVEYEPYSPIRSEPITSPYPMTGMSPCLWMYAITDDGAVSDGVQVACPDARSLGERSEPIPWLQWLAREHV